jgi:hypothetical protein
MSIRLQILLAEEEMKELKRLADEEHMTVSSWVRRAIRNEKKTRPETAARKKLEMVRKAAGYTFPTGSIEELAAEIETGYEIRLEP